MKERATKTFEENGRQVVLVPLGRTGTREAAIYLDDYDYLKSQGVSTNWYTAARGQVFATDKRLRGGNRSIARTLLQLQGAIVIYLDGDKTNLRRDNLSSRPSNIGKRSAVIPKKFQANLSSDVTAWVNWVGSEISGQNAFGKISVPIDTRVRGRFRK